MTVYLLLIIIIIVIIIIIIIIISSSSSSSSSSIIIFIPRKQEFKFHADCLLRVCMSVSNPIFLKRKRRKIFQCRLLKFLPNKQSINPFMPRVQKGSFLYCIVLFPKR